MSNLPRGVQTATLILSTLTPIPARSRYLLRVDLSDLESNETGESLAFAQCGIRLDLPATVPQTALVVRQSAVCPSPETIERQNIVRILSFEIENVSDVAYALTGSNKAKIILTGEAMSPREVGAHPSIAAPSPASSGFAIKSKDGLTTLTASSVTLPSPSSTPTLDAVPAPVANVSLAGYKITSLAAPTADNDAARKADVDAARNGLSIKDPARVATTANITLSGLQTIDGVSAVAGDRVLVKSQTTASQNGIYVVASGAWARSSDADSSSEVVGGLACWVNEGTVNGDKRFTLTTNNPITLGTTSLTFTQDSAGSFTPSGLITASGYNQNTNRLLGRTTAATGCHRRN